MTLQRAQHFRLPPDAIHVWVVPIAASLPQVQKFERLLAVDEAERASRFRFDHLRKDYIVTRGALRLLLGTYLECEPSDIRFEYSDRGKPRLSPPATLHFNLSHSHGLAAVALASGCPLGIDLEHIRPVADMEEIAARYFCSEEAAELLALPAGQREQAFFTCWTRKEAFIKAIGDGLACPLDSFRINFLPGSEARLVHIDGDRAAAGKWALHDLSLGSGFAAALAYSSARRSLSIFHFHELDEIRGE